MSLKYVVAAALVLGFAAPAAADDSSQFVIIKDANNHCRVVEKNLVSGAFSFGEPSPSTTVLLVWGFRIEA